MFLSVSCAVFLSLSILYFNYDFHNKYKYKSQNNGMIINTSKTKKMLICSSKKSTMMTFLGFEYLEITLI